MIMGAVHTAQYIAVLGPTSGQKLQETIRGILLTFTIIIVAVRLLSSFMSEQYGKMFGVLAAAIPVIGILVFPEQASGLLQSLWQMFVGS